MSIEDQQKYILDHYLKLTYKQIARDIGRSQTFVRGFLKRNSLQRPKCIADQIKRQSYFKKGQIPFNKGKKQESYMSPESIELTKSTRFKKGRRPHNTRLNGDLSVRQDTSGRSYTYIKIEDNHYELYHRFLWKQEKGVIPKGFNVQFKDGDTSNISLENLYLVSKKEQSIINKRGGHKIPYENRETIILINELKKVINEKQDNRLK